MDPGSQTTGTGPTQSLPDQRSGEADPVMLDLQGRVAALERQLERTRAARREAERLLEERSRDLWLSQQEVRRSEREYRLLAEHASDLVVRTDNDGVLKWVAPSFRTLGWEPEDLLGHRAAQFFHPDDLASVDEIAGTVTTGRSVTVELRFPEKGSGVYHWYRVHVTPVHDEHGTIVGRVAGWQNIDAVHASRVALEESEARFRHMFAEHGAIMLLIDRDTGRVVDANRAACDFYGHPPERLRTMTMGDLHERTPDSASRLRRLADTAPTSPVLFSRRLSDGTTRTVQVHSSTIDDQGRSRLFLIVRDITDDLAAREALAASEERFRVLAESMSDIVVTHDPDGVITWTSPSVRRVLGLDPASLVGVRLADLMHPDDAHNPASHLGEGGVGDGDDPEFACRARYRDAGGGYRMLEARTTFHHAPDGSLVAGQGVLRDVDAEVHAERELRESQRHYRLLAENSGDVVVLLDGKGRIAWASPSVTRLAGWQPQELLGFDTADLVHPEDESVVHEALDRTSSIGQATFLTRVRRTGGGWRWVNVVSRVVRGDDGSMTGIVANWRDAEADVAARRRLVQAYEKTVEARTTLQTSLDASVDAFAIYDIVRSPTDPDEVSGLRLVLMNRAGAAPLDLDPARIVGQDIREFYPAATDTGLWSAMLDAVRTGRPVLFRNEDAATDSTWDNRITPVGGERLVNVWRDVTPQARAERELAVSEERFRVAMTNAPVPMILAEPDGRLTEVNEALVDMLGHTRESLLTMTLADLTHPDDTALTAIPTGRDVATGQARVARDLRLMTRSGDVRWGQLSLSVVPGSGTGRVIAQILDVTEVRAAQEELAHQALHDPLTGLANRAMFQHELAASHQRILRSGRSLVVLFCDLDRFKQINDTHGHHIGDEVLVAVAERLRRSVRASDLIARLGGDEFVVVAEGLDVPVEAQAMAERVRAGVCVPLTVDGVGITPQTSIGLAVSQPGEDAEDVVRHADVALYQAKIAGRNQWRMFDPAPTVDS